MIAVPLPIAEIRRASADPRFVAAMGALYAELDADVAARAPVCTNRGACCRFEAYGHNLFVTAAELAFFIAASEDPLRAPADRSHCPYQQAGRCNARGARPAGCRIYFCDSNSAGWQPGLTEQTLRRIAALGEEFNIPYAYAEWTDSLRELGGTIENTAAISPHLPALPRISMPADVRIVEALQRPNASP